MSIIIGVIVVVLVIVVALQFKEVRESQKIVKQSTKKAYDDAKKFNSNFKGNVKDSIKGDYNEK